MTSPLFHMVANGPRPVAPFNHATEIDGWVFVTGQMPTDPKAPDAPLSEGVEAQTRRVMENLKLILAGIGLGRHKRLEGATDPLRQPGPRIGLAGAVTPRAI